MRYWQNRNLFYTDFRTHLAHCWTRLCAFHMIARLCKCVCVCIKVSTLCQLQLLIHAKQFKHCLAVTAIGRRNTNIFACFILLFLFLLFLFNKYINRTKFTIFFSLHLFTSISLTFFFRGKLKCKCCWTFFVVQKLDLSKYWKFSNVNGFCEFIFYPNV